MNGRSKTILIVVLAGVLAVGLLPGAVAGPAPKEADPKPAAKSDAKTSAPGAPATAGDWQARLTAKVLEWAGTTQVDYGYSLAYYRDPDNLSSIVGPFNDGRGNGNDPHAFLTFPSQAATKSGLRIFLDQMDAKNGSLEAVIEALEQAGDVTMLAEPTIVLKKGGPDAMVKTTARIPYASEQVAGNTVVSTTLFQETGVTLTVGFEETAEFRGEAFAKLKVKTSVSSLAGFVTVATDKRGDPLEAPRTESREISSKVLVRDKTTLITGILKEDAKKNNRQGPPILSDLPLIKYLFTNNSDLTETHELLFLLNVDLIRPGAV